MILIIPWCLGAIYYAQDIAGTMPRWSEHIRGKNLANWQIQTAVAIAAVVLVAAWPVLALHDAKQELGLLSLKFWMRLNKLRFKFRMKFSDEEGKIEAIAWYLKFISETTLKLQQEKRALEQGK